MAPPNQQPSPPATRFATLQIAQQPFFTTRAQDIASTHIITAISYSEHSTAMLTATCVTGDGHPPPQQESASWGGRGDRIMASSYQFPLYHLHTCPDVGCCKARGKCRRCPTSLRPGGWTEGTWPVSCHCKQPPPRIQPPTTCPAQKQACCRVPEIHQCPVEYPEAACKLCCTAAVLGVIRCLAKKS